MKMLQVSAKYSAKFVVFLHFFRNKPPVDQTSTQKIKFLQIQEYSNIFGNIFADIVLQKIKAMLPGTYLILLELKH
jgi:hypothetical protein